MRISANKESPFFMGDLLGHINVYWEGIPLDACVEASEEEGWADCLMRDDAGKFILEPSGVPFEHKIKIGRYTGRVHVQIMAGAL